MNIKKALVVDDSKVAHLTLRKLLTERKIEVDWVDSGEQAINYMRDRQPDIIFMDVMMPGLDGFETTKAITSDPAITAPPIIMCSANATDEDKQTAAQCGASDFLSKPYTPAQMDQVLQRVSDMVAAAPAALPPAAPAPTFAEISLVEPMADVLPASPPPAPPPPLVPSVHEALEVLGLDETPLLSEPVAATPPISTPAPTPPPAPMPAALPTPAFAPTAAAISHADIERIVRALVDPIVKTAMAEAAQKAEQTARSLAEEAGRKAAQVAVQAGQTVAKRLEEMINSHQETAQQQFAKMARTTAEQVARQISEEVVQSHQPRTPSMSPEVILREAEQQTYNAVQQSLEDFLKGRELNQRLNEFTKKTIMPDLMAATQDMVETQLQKVKSGGGGLVPMVIGVVALVLALAAVALKFIPL